MTGWEAALLGFLQGATEFLPVSSSGHLVVGQALMALDVPGVQFEVALHVATMVSVITVYWRRIRGLTHGALTRDRTALTYIGLVLIATIPAGVLGVGFENAIEKVFDAPIVPGVAFLVTGLLLWSTRGVSTEGDSRGLTARIALLIGLAQAVALVPGISRSGATVVMALWLGVSAYEAAAFSFLMSLPAIAGAAILQIPDLTAEGGALPASLLIGMAVAAVTGVVAIRTFVAVLDSGTFHRFAYYLWPLGVSYLGVLWWMG